MRCRKVPTQWLGDDVGFVRTSWLAKGLLGETSNSVGGHRQSLVTRRLGRETEVLDRDEIGCGDEGLQTIHWLT